MPDITLKGIPDRFADMAALRRLADETIPQAAAGVAELHIQPHEVTVSVLAGLLTWRARTEIMVYIEALWGKPERTKAVQDQLALAVGEAVASFAAKQMADQEVLVEVFVTPFEAAQKGNARLVVNGQLPQSPSPETNSDAPSCDICGHLTVRQIHGDGYKCLNCGNAMGG